MIIEQIFCLYFHRNNITNEIFYVGIGDISRPYSKTSRNRHWKNYVNKYDYTIDIVCKCLSWNQACKKEIFYINFIGRKDKKLGPLVNQTDGGQGSTGRFLSEKSRLKISNSLKGKPSKSKGLKRSKNTKLKMSLAKKGKPTWNKGIKYDEERLKKIKELPRDFINKAFKDKIRKSVLQTLEEKRKLGIKLNPQEKPVKQLDPINNQEIKIYNSCKHAAISLGMINKKESIRRHCNLKLVKPILGYIFRYIEN